MNPNTPKEKRCTWCKVIKPAVAFYANAGVLYPHCRVCHNEGVKARYKPTGRPRGSRLPGEVRAKPKPKPMPTKPASPWVDGLVKERFNDCPVCHGDGWQVCQSGRCHCPRCGGDGKERKVEDGS